MGSGGLVASWHHYRSADILPQQAGITHCSTHETQAHVAADKGVLAPVAVCFDIARNRALP
jgi:hypothetical protein